MNVLKERIREESKAIIVVTEYLDLKGWLSDTGDRKDGEITDEIKHAGDIIKAGGLVAFPTETVYGLGGDGLNASASKKIYAAKGRPSDNPLILHITEMEDLNGIVSEIPETAKILAENFWPGPLTMIFKKTDAVPLSTTGGLNTVAVRMPSHKAARALIKAAGTPIAAPSANSSGRPSPTKASHVKEDLDGKIDMIIDGGEVGIGLESTIVDVTGEVPVMLRPGYITKEMLDALFNDVEIDPVITTLHPDPNLRPKAPGMKYRHYAPKGDMAIFEGDTEEVVKRINKEAARAKAEGHITAVLATDETKDRYKADHVFSVGKRSDLYEVAHNLFDVLREFDEVGADRLFSESFSGDRLGLAIMNRLRKAAGYNIIKVG